MATILVVDDIEENIILLTYELADEGHEACAARDGRKCLEQAEQLKPALILLDSRRPHAVSPAPSGTTASAGGSQHQSRPFSRPGPAD